MCGKVNKVGMNFYQSKKAIVNGNQGFILRYKRQFNLPVEVARMRNRIPQLYLAILAEKQHL